MSKITVLLPNDEFSRFETYCDERGYKKSTLIARLIREHLDVEGFPNQGTLKLTGAPPTKLRRISNSYD